MTEALARAFTLQAGVCAAMGSPFSAGLLEQAAADIETRGALASLLAPFAGLGTRALLEEAVPIRWLGAAHDLALSREDPALAADYPGPDRKGDAAGAWRALVEAMAAQRAAFSDFLAHEPQTNEPRRSACLLPGFLTVARVHGLPLRLIELGASAGLNQLWDRFRYDYGSAGAWGDPASPVLTESEWRGAPFEFAIEPQIAFRAACDLKPVTLSDPRQRRRLRAYIWADQRERLARLEAAMALAMREGVCVEKISATDFVLSRADPEPGVATVIWHSIFWQYVPSTEQQALSGAILGQGAKARPKAPLAWLRMEPQLGNMAATELRLTQWPGGEEQLLAQVHPHGAWIDWTE